MGVGILLAASGIEGGLAIIAIMRPSPVQTTFFQPDPCMGWKHIPHKREGNTIVGRVMLDQPINSDGFRDREYPLRRKNGAFRIVVLGDSFADQLELPTQQLFHEILETKLNATARRPVDVINLGVAGFGTAQEYLNLKCYGMKYDPDLVILAFFVGNDLFDNSVTLYQQYVGHNPTRPFLQFVDGKLQRVDQTRRSTPIKRAASKLMPRTFHVVSREKTRSLQFLAALRAKTLGSGAVGTTRATFDGSYSLYQDPYPLGWDGAWAITKTLIKELATELNRSKMRLLVVVIPNEWEFRPDRWEQVLNENPQMRAFRFDMRKPERILEEFLHENRINYLMLRPALEQRTKKTGGDLHFHRPGDNHWTAEGHAIAASEIFEKLVRDGIMRTTQSPAARLRVRHD